MTAIELADSRKEWANDLLSLNEWSIDAETMLRQQQKKLEFEENRLKLSDDAFDAIERKVRGLQEDLTETNLLLSKVIEEKNDAYAEIEALKVKAHEWYLISMEKAQEK